MQISKASRTIDKLLSGTPVRLIGIGDSLTYGWMAEKGYLDYLNELLLAVYPGAALQIINRGIPGDTAEGGMRRLHRDVINARPDCVLIQFALNDAFLGVTPEQFAKDIRGMILEISKNSDADIVLLTSVWIADPEENDRALMFYHQLEIIAEEEKLPIARVHVYWEHKIESGTNTARLVQFDGVHPTAAGYQVMAEAIYEVFEHENPS